MPRPIRLYELLSCQGPHVLIPELYTSHLTVNSQTGSAGGRAWTTGQILDATVVRQALDGTVTLRIGSHNIQAQTGLKLAADQSVTLQVAQAGAQVVLRVLNTGNATHLAQPATPPGLPTTEATLAQAWRQVLPREGSLQPLLGQLNNANPAPGATSTLPAAVATALRQLTARLPAFENLLSAGGLRQSIRNSGLFLEGNLAQTAQHGTPIAPAGDFKAGLLTLLAQLRAQPSATPGSTSAPAPAALPGTGASLEPAVSALLRQTDAALARVEHNQLTALSGRADGSVPLIIELPVRDGGDLRMLRLQIEPDDSGRAATGQATPWSVALDMDLGPLGSLHIQITLHGESVAAAFWTPQPDTAGLIQEHLNELSQSLQHAGLTPAALTCQAGAAPPMTAQPTPTTTVLDERA